jgi:hypothetical protein
MPTPSRRIAHFVLIWAIVIASVLAFSRPGVSAQTEPADYDIPNGHFYTQAHPGGKNGEGYSVTDSLGIAFWDAFLQNGGWRELGYPLSRRFIAGGRVVQAFQRGALAWNVEATSADRLDISALGEIPATARVPELAHRAEGQSSRQPWSGWWWSVSGAGPALDSFGGPLWKYDRAVLATRGESPGTREWEASELSPAGLGLLWAGHCNGWAAAAILEEEPQTPREFGGINFTVGDQKGLLSDLHFADSASWAYGGNDDLNPADFHRMLLTWMGEQKKAMIVTFRIGDNEIWSYPAYRFQLQYGPDPKDPDWSVVETTVWLVDNDVPPDFVGARHWPSNDGKEFRYRIKGPVENPTDGMWTGISENGRFSHPYQIWHPEPRQRNIDRQLIAPGLDESMIREITGIRLATPTPTATATSAPTASATPTVSVTPTPINPTTPESPTPTGTPVPGSP